MVLTILNSGRSAKAALNYNFGKVAKNVAEVVYTGNMKRPPHGVLCPELFVRELFKTYESNYKIRGNTRNLAFHLAINPGEGDNMTEAKTIQFIKEYMREMGFGTQPFIVFRHNDILREHYHLICPLVDADGKVIFYRRRREALGDPKDKHNWSGIETKRVAERLAPKFGFTFGKGTGTAEGVDVKVAQPAGEVVSRGEFMPTAPNVLVNMAYLFKEALKYNFRTEGELKDVLFSMGLRMNVIRGADEQHSKVTLQGVDRWGKANGRVFEITKALGQNPVTMFVSRMGENIRRSRESIDSGQWCPMNDIDYSMFPLEHMGPAIAMKPMLYECFKLTSGTEEWQKAAEEVGMKVVVRRGEPDAEHPDGTVREIFAVHPQSHTLYPAQMFGETIVHPSVLNARERQKVTWWAVRLPEKTRKEFLTPEQRQELNRKGRENVGIFNEIQERVRAAHAPSRAFTGFCIPLNKKGHGI